MKVTVWIVSGLLAVAFLGIGMIKVITPAAEMAAMSQGVPVILLKIAGYAEVLGALGLILPAASRIAPILTPVAAGGLVLTMTGATITNIITGQYNLIPMTVILGLVAGFVAWARFGRYTVQPRNAVQHASH